MKSYSKILKVLSLILALAVISVSFAACSSVEKAKENPTEQSQVSSDSGQAEQIPENPVTKLGKKDNTLTPDTDAIKLEPESEKAVECSSEEKCVEMLGKFVNPEGNEYDALSVLGSFRYPDKSEEELMKTLKTASDTWHKAIEEKIGEKCIVRITLDEKTSVDLSDPAVADWNAVNGKTAEAFSNVKCYVATNYVDNEVKISFDLVKLDSSWYLANVSTLSKIQNVITTELYR